MSDHVLFQRKLDSYVEKIILLFNQGMIRLMVDYKVLTNLRIACLIAP